MKRKLTILSGLLLIALACGVMQVHALNIRLFHINYNLKAGQDTSDTTTTSYDYQKISNTPTSVSNAKNGHYLEVIINKKGLLFYSTVRNYHFTSFIVNTAAFTPVENYGDGKFKYEISAYNVDINGQVMVYDQDRDH